jgi:uncharacterized protein YycO
MGNNKFVRLLGGLLIVGLFISMQLATTVKGGGLSNALEGLQEGDIVFQSSMSGQSYAIQLATNSKYSHCGILLKTKTGKLMVAEAVQPVVFTPLSEWIRRGDDYHCVVKRLTNAEEVMTENVLAEMRKTMYGFVGKNYDLKFAWDDKEMYCSELVWKIYERCTSLRLGEPQPMKNYNLEHPVVQKIMKERYGNKIPYEMPMIAPSSIFESELLETVKVF